MQLARDSSEFQFDRRGGLLEGVKVAHEGGELVRTGYPVRDGLVLGDFVRPQAENGLDSHGDVDDVAGVRDEDVAFARGHLFGPEESHEVEGLHGDVFDGFDVDGRGDEVLAFVFGHDEAFFVDHEAFHRRDVVADEAVVQARVHVAHQRLDLLAHELGLREAEQQRRCVVDVDDAAEVVLGHAQLPSCR